MIQLNTGAALVPDGEGGYIDLPALKGSDAPSTAEDISYDGTLSSHEPGSVGAELSQQSSAIENKLDKAQGTANAGKVMEVGTNGAIFPAAQRVHYINYGESSYQEISTWLNAGDLVIVRYLNGNEYNTISMNFKPYNTTTLYGINPSSTGVRHISLNASNQWYAASTKYETVSNLVTSLSSASTDTQYPSAKAVYDYCLRDWVGTQAEYDAIAIKDAHTRYNIVEATT